MKRRNVKTSKRRNKGTKAQSSLRCVCAALLVYVLEVNVAVARERSPASQSSTTEAKPSYNERVTEAAAALQAGEYDRAIEAYRAAAKLKPDAAELPYNEGVAHYRKGDYRKAAELFTQALGASDAALSARSKFNLGNCAYAEALNDVRQAQSGDPTTAPNLLKSAATGVKEAAGHYRETLSAAPGDADARANLELSHRLLKLIEEMQKQMQQSPSSQPDEQQEQDQQQQQEQQSQQSGESGATSQPSDAEQSQTTQPSSQPSEEEQQPQPSSAPASQPQESPSPDEESAEAQQPPQSQPAASQPQNEEDQRSLSRAEAERLLQLIRDKERQRRLEQARRAEMKKEPVKKDW